MKIILPIFVLLFSSFVSAQKNEVVNVLILQTIDHHNTAMQAETFKGILEATGTYNVEMILSNEGKDWYEHDLVLSDYHLVISSSLGFENIPEKPLIQLEKFISNGGGLVMVHQGVGSFEDYPKFQEIIGIGWYGSHTGPHTYWDDQINNWAETPIYHGVGPAHGKQHEIVVEIRNEEHPITKGMPLKWKHGMDEFYHGMRGSAKNIKILATAYSDKVMWGSGEHEPIAWTSKYGKGRIFVTVLGHLFKEENADDIPGINSMENGTKAIYCVGFQALFARGAEWAATGQVTVGFPSNFPSSDKVVIAHPREVKWKKKVSNKK